MKNLLRLLGIIALVAAIGFNLAGCGGDDGGSDTPSPGPGQTPTTPTPVDPSAPTTTCVFADDGWVLNPSAVPQTSSQAGQEWNPCTNHEGQHKQLRTLYAWGSKDDGLVLNLNAAGTEYNVAINDNLNLADVYIPAYFGYRHYVSNGVEIKTGTYADFKPVTSIVIQAFAENTNIENVEFLEGTQLRTISEKAFSGCSSLESIKIPAGVTTIAEAVFAGCTLLETVTFVGNSGLTTISDGAFEGCTSLEGIVIPSGVTTIGPRAFKGAEALARINIPVGITIINESVFENCEALATVVFARSHRVVTIGKKAFSGCEALDTLTEYIPNNFTTIGEEAFSGCTSIPVFEITRTVTAVGNKAFKDWTAAQRLNVLGKVAPAANPPSPHATADAAWGYDDTASTGWRAGTNADIRYEN